MKYKSPVRQPARRRWGVLSKKKNREPSRKLHVERLEDRTLLAIDFYTFEGHTYFRTESDLNFADASKLASDLGGYLVSINSLAEQQFVANTFSLPNSIAYIGLSDTAVEGTFKWLSNQPLTYTNWGAGEPNNWQGNEDAAVIDSTGKWNDIAVTIPLQAVIEIPTLMSYYGGSLYFLSKRGLSWSTAESAAIAVGGNLASIGSSSEQDWIFDHVGSQAPFFIGLNDVAEEGQFVWSDNTSLTYQNWLSGQPNNGQGSEDYTQFRIDGRWNDVGSNSRMPGLIEVPVGGNSQFFGKHEYSIDNVYSNWESARARAIQRGGELVAIQSAAEQSFIETNLLNGDYYFLGLNDLAEEGNFVWSNQQLLTYSNWQANEPNDWQGEDLVLITPTGQWNDVPSSHLARAIQEYDWQRPNATVVAPSITLPSTDPYRFTVRISDDVRLQYASLDNRDIQITGPSGFVANASLVSVDRNFDSPVLTATYEIDARGGNWESTDNGTYSVRTVRRELRDVSGNAVPAKILGSFSVNVAARGTIAISTPQVSVIEGTPFVDVLVSRTEGSQGIVSFDYTTSNASAIAGRDFVAQSGTMSLADGQTSAVIRIPITDDHDLESNETFSVSLDRVEGGAILGTVRTALITILDNGDPALGTGTGLRAAYYSDANLTNLVSSRIDSSINFNWGYGAPIPGMPSDSFSIRWSGWIEPRYSEEYVFELTVDDGVRLWIADQLLIDAWTTQDTTLQTPPVSLESGRRYPFRLDYFENTGRARAEIKWSSTQQSKEIVPASQLYDGAAGPSIIAWSRSSVQVEESDGVVSVTAYRSGNSSLPLTVRVKSLNDTAVAGADFQAVDQILSFAAGHSSVSFNVALTNDTNSEMNESFFLELSSPSQGSLGALTTIRIDIADDDLGTFVTENIVTGLVSPTAIDWSDTGLMFIAQKSGVIRVLDGTTLLPQPFADLSDIVNNVRDRGLLGLAVHPNFPTQPYVYVSYTYDPPETAFAAGLAARDREGNRVARISRLTADATTNFRTLVPSSEFVLVGNNSTWANISRPDLDSTGDINIPPSCGNAVLDDCILTDSQSHTIGQLRFGLDGALFASIGDGASYGRVDPRAARTVLLESLSGKMLRVDPITGQGLADNPYFDGNPNSNRSKVDSTGFRNPFRFVVHPITGDPYIGDVGWNNWEEINFGRGANFGWPFYEGRQGVSVRTNGYQDLTIAQNFYASGEIVAPSIIARSHADGAQAILAGDFYTGNVFPPVFQGGMIIGDINQGNYDLITFNDAYAVTGSHRFINNQPGIVQIATGSDGLIYFVNLATGTVGRWRPGIQGQSHTSPANDLEQPSPRGQSPVNTTLAIQFVGLQTAEDASQPTSPYFIAPTIKLDGYSVHRAEGVESYLRGDLATTLRIKSEAVAKSLLPGTPTDAQPNSKARRIVKESTRSLDRAANELTEAVDHYFAKEFRTVI
jgi:glucose/arabinose dehydrogenase